jgi:pimeloyl-ACP methyl ester carboxylesterase
MAAVAAAPRQGHLSYVTATQAEDVRSGYTIDRFSIQAEDGTELAAMLYSPKRGRTKFGVVFPPGFTSGKEEIFPIVRYLTDEYGATLLVYDPRSHGNSGGRIEHQKMIEDISAFYGIVAQISDYVLLSGHSLGAYCSGSNIANNQHEQVVGTVLLSTPDSPPASFRRFRFQDFVFDTVTGDQTLIRRATKTLLKNSGFRYLANKGGYRGYKVSDPRQVETDLQDISNAENLSQKRIPVKTLLLAGTDDTIAPVSDSERIYAHAVVEKEGSGIVRLRGSDHHLLGHEREAMDIAYEWAEEQFPTRRHWWNGFFRNGRKKAA